MCIFVCVCAHACLLPVPFVVAIIVVQLARSAGGGYALCVVATTAEEAYVKWLSSNLLCVDLSDTVTRRRQQAKSCKERGSKQQAIFYSAPCRSWVHGKALSFSKLTGAVLL